MRLRFNHTIDWIIRVLGSPSALAVAALAIVIWALTGPIFGFSDTWQLVINTSTTIITFPMVFVIQNAANRDAKAVHIKLDELVTSIEGARNKVVLAERATEEEQDREIERLKELAQRLGGTEAAIEGSGDSVADDANSGAPGSAQRRELGEAPTEPA